jgi:hypothetical protein
MRSVLYRYSRDVLHRFKSYGAFNVFFDISLHACAVCCIPVALFRGLRVEFTGSATVFEQIPEEPQHYRSLASPSLLSNDKLFCHTLPIGPLFIKLKRYKLRAPLVLDQEEDSCFS